MSRWKKRKRKRVLRKFLLTIGILLIGILGVSAYLFYQTYQAADKSYNSLDREKSDLREDTVSISDDPVSILLLGIEDYATGGTNGRADSIMVVTFNQQKESLKMLSIPRDTLVTIAGKGTEDKINHSYAFGGEKMTVETVESFLDIPIDYYATVNFEGFKNVIDIVDGVNVNVPFDFTEKNADETEILHYTEGPMELNGEQALGYARMRKQDPRGDLGRADRQKEIVQATIEKVSSAGTLFKVDELTDVVGENIVTNMKLSELLSFYQKYHDFNTDNIEQLTLDGHALTLDGIYYYQIEQESLSKITKTLRDHLGIESYTGSDSNNSANTEVTNDYSY